MILDLGGIGELRYGAKVEMFVLVTFINDKMVQILVLGIYHIV